MGRMTLAKLQMMRESGGRGMRGEDGGEYGSGGRRPGMTYYPPNRRPEMAYDDREPHIGMRRRNDGSYDGYDGGSYARRMGFEDDEEPGMRRLRNDGSRMHYGSEHEGREPVRFGGVISMEEGRRHHQRMTREIAEEWTGAMEGADPAKPHGAKWTPEQVKPIAAKYGVPTEGDRFWEFYAVMNAMYSDYYVVAKKYNQLTPDFFADMAMAFISDKDAVENKAMMYYECIVEK